MAYFSITTGLRGGYMPDNGYVVRANTRRELKAVIAQEAWSFKDAGFIGANKKAIAWIAAIAWRNRHKLQLPYALALAPEHARGNYCHGIFISSSDRSEWLAQDDACF